MSEKLKAAVENSGLVAGGLRRLSRKQAEAAADSLPPETVKKLQSMFDYTWDQCAPDWLDLFPRKQCDGGAVQECVADADRFDMANDKEAAAFWRGLPRPVKDVLLDRFFPPKKKFGY